MGSVTFKVIKKDRHEYIDSMPNEHLAEAVRDLDDDMLADLALSLLSHGDQDNFHINKKMEDTMDDWYSKTDPDSEPWAYEESDEEYERANALRPDLV